MRDACERVPFAHGEDEGQRVHEGHRMHPQQELQQEPQQEPQPPEKACKGGGPLRKACEGGRPLKEKECEGGGPLKA